VAADAPTGPAEARVSVIHCGHLVDVIGGKVLGATTVIVEGKRVREVVAGTGAAAPAGATEIDLSTQTCLPGLIDSHTHLSDQFGPTKYTDEFHWNTADYVVRSTVYARRTLLAGFTTVRNLGDSANEVAALRNAINAGVVVGPRIYTPVTKALLTASSTVRRTPSKPCECITRRAMMSSKSCPQAACWIKARAAITRK
jgi:imidazolonepropionase-like amidohydrolase